MHERHINKETGRQTDKIGNSVYRQKDKERERERQTQK